MHSSRDDEFTRTFQFTYDPPLVAEDPREPGAELSLKQFAITLRARWDERSSRWVLLEGEPLMLWAPQAKRMIRGKASRYDAFHGPEGLKPVGVPLGNIHRSWWGDRRAEELHDEVHDRFWRALFT